MKYFIIFIRENIKWFLAVSVNGLLMTAVMLLNHIEWREIAYGLLICVAFTVAIAGIGTWRYRNHCKELEMLIKSVTVSTNGMPSSQYLYETQYQECLRLLEKEKESIQNEIFDRQRDITEYYAMWVHQIKTPIAALKLLIDEELDFDDAIENDIFVINTTKKQQELFKIEQYVDMALQYTRLGANTNDFVIREVNLDSVIKNTIHKYAAQFIYKKLYLHYEPTQLLAVTDDKWLGFVIGQLLSNAIKYTKAGGITIQTQYKEHNTEECQNAEYNPLWEAQKNEILDFNENTDLYSKLSSNRAANWMKKKDRFLYQELYIIIEDTGIGIKAEDLPRVCERGYTGYNGHDSLGAGRQSTGIGLYLCKQILDRLGHKLLITSKEGEGTRAKIVIRYANDG
ncbi:MAG: ATP-binding protein [Lachnospiraceae bacterium]|nr:ATP-binding protein [Lachnospiraceae bacterium]